MLGSFSNRLLFPSPQSTYTAESYPRHLCWIPWNPVISPSKVSDPLTRDVGIPCLWFPAPRAASVLVFFHGNAEDLGMVFAILKHMRNQFKINILGVEYPGYGLLRDMTTSEEGIREVALTVLRYQIDQLGVSYDQIVIMGRSLGSGPAVYLASQYPVGGLILVSAFTSVRAAVSNIAGPLIAWSFIDGFKNSTIMPNVSCSCLFIHGEKDHLIPVDHTLTLFHKCRARKLLITPPEMEHNSNLFSDCNFLAVPAIHFFGFPGYYTATPPRPPASTFKVPPRILKQLHSEEDLRNAWLCHCESSPERVPVTKLPPEQSDSSVTTGQIQSSANNSSSKERLWRDEDEEVDAIRMRLGDLEPDLEPKVLLAESGFLEDDVKDDREQTTHVRLEQLWTDGYDLDADDWPSSKNDGGIGISRV